MESGRGINREYEDRCPSLSLRAQLRDTSGELIECIAQTDMSSTWFIIPIPLPLRLS